MRTFLWILLGIGILIAAAVGLLPPVLARGTLDTETVNAAKAGSAALGGSNAQAANAAVVASLAGHPEVKITQVKVSGSEVLVTTTETVHSWLSGLPGLKGWFHISSTQTSDLGA